MRLEKKENYIENDSEHLRLGSYCPDLIFWNACAR